MIRVYGYYNFGGYKDMYLGNSDDKEDMHYYLPLLSVMRKRKSDADKDNLKRLEKLPQIKILSEDNLYGLPQECIPFFSHAGYKVIYETLDKGKVCISVQGIPCKKSKGKDESPSFSLMFVADSEKDILLMDGLMEAIRNEYNDWMDFLGRLFSYESDVNGLSFHVADLFLRLKDIRGSHPLDHTPGKVDCLVVSDFSKIDIVLKIFNLKRSSLIKVYDVQGKEYPTVDNVDLKSNANSVSDALKRTSKNIKNFGKDIIEEIKTLKEMKSHK